MLTISKDYSTLIKGIVIIMMVFLHLFSGNRTDLCVNLLYIGNEPMAKWLANACGPVDFFLLLSGYGLAYTYDHKGLWITQQVKRILKLYIHYWIVLLLFLPIACFMMPEYYPGGWGIFLMNILGWETTYDAPMWFLLPYCGVSMLSPWFFKFIKQMGYIKVLFITAVIHIVTCYMISRYGSVFLFNNMLLYLPLLMFHFLYAFTVGILFYYYRNVLTKIPSWIAVITIFFMVILVASFGNALIYMIYVPLMFFLLCQISYSKWIELFLIKLGRQSMRIWMIHIWYCYHLFQSQIYSLKYPILILVGTIIISYLTAIPVMWTAKRFFYILKI